MSENQPISLPSRKRVVWEHFGDLLRVNWWLSILLAVALGCVIVQSFVLLAIYNRPPYILTEDQGYVMYRTTSPFRLSEANVENYTDVVSGTLLDMSPGAYDLTPLVSMVRPAILDKYRRDAEVNSVSRKATGERTYWSLYGVRRIFEDRYPEFIILAVQGEVVNLSAQPDPAPGGAPERPISNPVLLKFYLKTVRPTPDNPFGLFLVGVANVPADSASQVWESAKPLSETLAPDGLPYAKRGASPASLPGNNR
jgi:hypothetical protein